MKRFEPISVSEKPGNQCNYTHTVRWLRNKCRLLVFDSCPKNTVSQISPGFRWFYHHRCSEGALGSFAELWIAPGGGCFVITVSIFVGYIPSGWWFGTCFISPYIGNSNPN